MEQILEQQIWSEASLLELLGVEKRTLDNLRNQKGFPFVSLSRKARVYIAGDVSEWVINRANLYK